MSCETSDPRFERVRPELPEPNWALEPLRTLEPAEVSARCSGFLSKSVTAQRYRFEHISTNPRRAQAVVGIIDSRLADEQAGLFCLPDSLISPIVVQLGIVHALTELEMQPGFPVWPRDFSSNYHQSIETTRFLVELHCYEAFALNGLTVSRRGQARRVPRSNFRYRFSVDNGAFTGDSWLVFRM